MFVQREHAAEDKFRKSNLELKELERESKPSVSKPVPRYSQFSGIFSGPSGNMKEEK